MALLTLLPLLFVQSVGPAAPAAHGSEVVVTARRDTGAYARCLASGCSPEDEVEAAMNSAAALFREGRYNDAYKLLKQAVGRNRKYESRMPGKMSDLYATLADVSQHWGQTADYQASTWSSARVLRTYLGASHPASLTAGIRVGDMLATTKSALDLTHSVPADHFYEKLARDAAAGGRTRLAALITFRRAWVAFAWRQMTHAQKMLDEVDAESNGDPKIAALVRALRVRIAIVQHDDATAERLLAAWQTVPTEAPVLISEPGMFAMQPLKLGLSELMTPDGKGKGDVRWVDIGFWVRPSGAVEEAEVLRPDDAASWAEPLADRILQRRYLPLAEDAGNPGSYQIERYSLRREFDTRVGSRIVGRVGDFGVIKASMTNAAGSKPAKPGAAQSP